MSKVDLMRRQLALLKATKTPAQQLKGVYIEGDAGERVPLSDPRAQQLLERRIAAIEEAAGGN